MADKFLRCKVVGSIANSITVKPYVDGTGTITVFQKGNIIIDPDTLRVEGAEEMRQAIADICQWCSLTKHKYLNEHDVPVGDIAQKHTTSEILTAWRQWKSDNECPKRGEIWVDEDGRECLVHNYDAEIGRVHVLFAKTWYSHDLTYFVEKYERTGKTHDMPELAEGRANEQT